MGQGQKLRVTPQGRPVGHRTPAALDRTSQGQVLSALALVVSKLVTFSWDLTHCINKSIFDSPKNWSALILMSVFRVLVLNFIFYRSCVNSCTKAGTVLMECGAGHLVRPLLSRAERMTLCHVSALLCAFLYSSRLSNWYTSKPRSCLRLPQMPNLISRGLKRITECPNLVSAMSFRVAFPGLLVCGNWFQIIHLFPAHLWNVYILKSDPLNP